MIKFYSYNELVDYIMNGSNIYEENNGIKTISNEILLDKGDIVFLGVNKSDNTKTLFVLFKLSRKMDIWSYLTPSENQVKVLAEDLKDFYKGIDFYNYLNKNSKKRT